MDKVFEYCFRVRGPVAAIILIVVGFFIILSSPHFPEGSLMDILFDSAAWAMLAACIGLRLWATLFVGGRKDTELVMAGPYSLSRNPLYLGSLSAAISVVLFLNSFILVGAVFLVGAFYFRFVIPFEEQRLEAKFGEEYRHYCAVTPRLFPRALTIKSPDVIEVRLPALYSETKRLLRVCLIPILAEVIGYLRTADWFPHWFRLP